ncbi:ferritin-like domain-containing protein [uncultured Aquabacterium sp.]|uniref:ferritin-like domain-containing protein n=1 Tax=Aquabacterium sp. TaxID=1872578 RepID=UPI0025E9337A|nr:ferritin-like domain-containing protein [uncultured Aquabacterium sp.]
MQSQQTSAHMGMNRTGAKMSPIDVSAMEEYAAASPVSEFEGEDTMAAMRIEAIAEADTLGSVPLPGTLKGMMTTGVSMLKGDNPAMLIDKLGERLAFERTGTRLYEALITKSMQLMPPGDPRLTVLQRIHDQEAEHFQMLAGALQSLGADPTAQTPCADVAAQLSSGILQVVTDPRTDLAQSLNAILVAELADNASWELLETLLRQTGHDEMADSFGRALSQEAEHVMAIRQMLEDSVMASA